MKCPCCKAEFVPVDDVVFDNVRQYGMPATILSKCCNNVIMVSRRVVFDLQETNRREDSWGNVKVTEREKLLAQLNEIEYKATNAAGLPNPATKYQFLDTYHSATNAAKMIELIAALKKELSK